MIKLKKVYVHEDIYLSTWEKLVLSVVINKFGENVSFLDIRPI